MYNNFFRKLNANFPVDFVLRCVRKIYETDRWFSFDRMRQTCKTVESIMQDMGLIEVKTIKYPADGSTTYGGWVMPQAWDAREAILEIVDPHVPDAVLCQYTKVPCSLILGSAPGHMDKLSFDVE